MESVLAVGTNPLVWVSSSWSSFDRAKHCVSPSVERPAIADGAKEAVIEVRVSWIEKSAHASWRPLASSVTLEDKDSVVDVVIILKLKS